MKGLLFHCKSFKFKDTLHATKPVGIHDLVKSNKFREGDYRERVVAFTCMEKGDTPEDVIKAAEHINHMIKEWHSGNNNVLVLPFGHLSKNLAEPEYAMQLLGSLKEKLTEFGNTVELLPFGTHKEFAMDVYGYPRATSYFQFSQIDQLDKHNH